ncbi:HD domain-containing protein [Fundidesulfovibrio agrisoli]|uniref:HD domain-containing protein n=1 Tax=Fundidesulfovibrio agrisoli TaxID=2922717 RepID=UPI001FAE401B|nr:HD domain-containing protein [Fundidesulfovibrio agrisoli]
MLVDNSNQAGTTMRTPSRTEALALLEQHQSKPERIAHSVAVAELALAIRDRLAERGHVLDRGLVESAALLHDMCKGQPDHDRAAGELLRGLGYPEVAAVAEVHTRLAGRTPQEPEPVSAAEVVYMADKSYRRTTRVSVEDRYAIWLKTWEGNAEKLASLENGQRRAETVRARIERAMGLPLDQVGPKP